MKLKYNFYSQSIIQALIKTGVDKKRIFEIPGISVDLSDPLASEITIEFIHHLTLFYRKELETQHCGLEIIQNLDFNNTDFFGPYAFSCPTLNDAVKKIYEVYSSLNPLISYEMYPKEKPHEFIYHIDKIWEAKYPESADEILEFVIANGLLSSRSLTKQEIVPVKLSLKRKKPSNIQIYNDIFKCPVYFESENNSITYQQSIMDYKIPTYNPTLLSILQEFAQKIIRENELNKDVVSEVKAILMQSGNYKSPKEDDVASELNMSKRNLQHILQKKNITFLQIVENIQKELAFTYLHSELISNKETAWMLGYNDISNFYRAFKRWTGMTPNEYRSLKSC